MIVPEIMIDRHMIEQVLMNLILNAIQAMRAGGVLAIRTTVESANCLVHIRDSGCGISPSVLPRIFDPFFTTKNEGEGTGLGLSVSLGIVERHGGKILVESEVGKGTTFTVSIPLAIATLRRWEVFVRGLKVLIVDDEPLMRLSMLDALEAVGCEVTAAATGTEGLVILGTRQFDIVITDLRLPGADGLTILRASKERSPTTEVILITAHGSVDTAVGAINLGAYDYITKPFQMDELLLIVERVGKIIGLRRENIELKEVLEGRFSFSGMHGCSHHMRGLLERIKLLAATDSPVSIIGERGTGKELVAHAIHLNSPRRNQPLIKVCCADLPEDLMESELFGHEKGAIPAAVRQRRGRFELAHKGTLFLDDIGALSPALQAKLLRLLQEEAVPACRWTGSD